MDGKFVAVKADLDTVALSKLKYIPSVTGGRDAVALAATEMKKAGMLNASTDVDALSDVPEAILVCERGEEGTTIRRLEPEALAEWLKTYSLGELWRRGQLGGNRW